MIQGPSYRNTPRDGADLHVIFPAAVPEARPLIPVKAPGAKGEPTIRLLRRFPAELGAPAETVRWTGETRGGGGGGGGRNGGGGGRCEMAGHRCEDVERWSQETVLSRESRVSTVNTAHTIAFSFPPPPPPSPHPAQKPRSPYSSSPKCQRPVDSALFSPAFFFFFFFFPFFPPLFFFFFFFAGSSVAGVQSRPGVITT